MKLALKHALCAHIGSIFKRRVFSSLVKFAEFTIQTAEVTTKVWCSLTTSLWFHMHTISRLLVVSASSTANSCFKWLRLCVRLSAAWVTSNTNYYSEPKAQFKKRPFITKAPCKLTKITRLTLTQQKQVYPCRVVWVSSWTSFKTTKSSIVKS